MEKNNAVVEAQDFLNRIKPMMSIKRLPPEVMNDFKSMAKERFNDDYGIALTWIMQELKRFQMEEAITSQFIQMLGDVERRVLKLEQMPKEESKKIRLCDGSVREIPAKR